MPDVADPATLRQILMSQHLQVRNKTAGFSYHGQVLDAPSNAASTAKTLLAGLTPTVQSVHTACIIPQPAYHDKTQKIQKKPVCPAPDHFPAKALHFSHWVEVL
jgi:hypothetical protein